MNTSGTPIYSKILELPVGVQLPAEVASELNMRFLWIGKQLDTIDAIINRPNPFTVIGTRNERLNIKTNDANNFKGAVFYETDTALIYLSQPLQSGGAGYVWKYLSGTVLATYSSPLASAPVFGIVLGVLDAGLLVYLTDKNRTMRWSGSVWGFAPTEAIPTGMILGFKTSPGMGWHLCDGTTQTQLNSDGTTSSVTLDDLTTTSAKAVYPKWANVADGVQAAVAPTISGHTENDNGTPVQAQPYATGTAVNVPQEPHTHNLTSADAPITTTGEPQHYDLVPYQRI